MRFTGPTLLLVPPLRTVRESLQLTRSSLRERSNHERARVRSDGVASGEIRGARPCCQSDIKEVVGRFLTSKQSTPHTLLLRRTGLNRPSSD